MYDKKYVLNFSARRDGANIFGVKINDKITPLWSMGLGWNISNESFYSSNFLPQLKVRATYGYNGNVYYGSAYLSGRYSIAPVTGVETILINSAPNPSLRWEKVKNLNLGIDWTAQNGILNGSFEFYQKDGNDLIQPTTIAPQTGFTTVMANTAKTKTQGIDLTVQSNNLKGALKWSTTLLLSTIKDKLIAYDAPQTNTSIQNYGEVTGLIGKPLYSVFSYKYTGLDSENGDPTGIYNGEKSKDYLAIINNFNPDSLIYSGSARPTKFGSLRNDFNFRGFNLSFNVVFKLGYVFRRTSTPLNYADLIESKPNVDYQERWQKPGDESKTIVPSLVVANDRNRDNFYTYSDILVESGDHFRLQDIRLSYQFSQKWIQRSVFKNIQIYGYMNNIAIIWKKNKYNIDPDTGGFGIPNPFSISFGINAKL